MTSQTSDLRPPASGRSRKNKSVLREWLEAALVALILAGIIRTFVIQAFRIPSGSMRPTLMEGDLILVNKFIYGAKVPLTNIRLPKARGPNRGDVIVFIYPEDPTKDYIKRLAAFPGETVEIKNGTLYINDRPLLDPVFNQRYYYNRGDMAQEGNKIKMPEKCYFVLGDNSASSKDSRYWGYVPEQNILGKAVVIYWPPQRIRIVR